MAIDIHLVTRATMSGTPEALVESDGDNDKRNGIEAVLIAIDDSVDTTDALIRTRASTVLNAAGYDLPAAYFTDNVQVAGAVSSQVLDTAGDYALFGDFKELSQS